MRRRDLVPITLALALLVAPGANAHHSYARFDRCHLFSVAGEIQDIKWHNPHVELQMRASDGTAYRIVWLNLQQLKRDGVEFGVLKTGDWIEVTAAKQPEDMPHIIALVTQIWRPSDGWRWSRPPQGC